MFNFYDCKNSNYKNMLKLTFKLKYKTNTQI